MRSSTRQRTARLSPLPRRPGPPGDTEPAGAPDLGRERHSWPRSEQPRQRARGSPALPPLAHPSLQQPLPAHRPRPLPTQSSDPGPRGRSRRPGLTLQLPAREHLPDLPFWTAELPLVLGGRLGAGASGHVHILDACPPLTWPSDTPLPPPRPLPHDLYDQASGRQWVVKVVARQAFEKEQAAVDAIQRRLPQLDAESAETLARHTPVFDTFFVRCSTTDSWVILSPLCRCTLTEALAEDATPAGRGRLFHMVAQAALAVLATLSSPLLGSCHCDIKPDNLMLCADAGGEREWVRLIDFGSSSTGTGDCGGQTPEWTELGPTLRAEADAADPSADADPDRKAFDAARMYRATRAEGDRHCRQVDTFALGVVLFQILVPGMHPAFQNLAASMVRGDAAPTQGGVLDALLAGLGSQQQRGGRAGGASRAAAARRTPTAKIRAPL